MSYPALSENPTNEEINVALKWSINRLRNHRATHVDWREWFRSHPDDPRQESLGDADFHNESVQGYNSVLAVLEAVLTTDADQQEDR